MIGKVSGITMNCPSFGLAKLTRQGRIAADEFGYEKNEFANDKMYHKQGPFERSALEEELAKGKSFEDVCQEYATSNLGAINAAFIQSQVLSKKGGKVLKSMPKDNVKAGLKVLYEKNYDNPELSQRDTKRLIETYKPFLEPSEYVKNIGLVEAGSSNK